MTAVLSRSAPSSAAKPDRGRQRQPFAGNRWRRGWSSGLDGRYSCKVGGSTIAPCAQEVSVGATWP